VSNSKKEVVVIIGTGRSGTSLLVQLLLEMGMYNQENFNNSSEEEPLGLFEDLEIVDLHKSMLSAVGVHAMTPHVGREFTVTEKKQFKEKIKNILSERILNAGDKLWGFKDPRTTLFLPIWLEVFNEMGIKPRFLLAQRNPVSVISSMMKQNENGQSFAELAWLVRSCEAIIQTKGQLFVVNYEDWFGSEAIELGQSLARYLSLPNDGIEVILERKILDKLNRTSASGIEISNSLVRRLYNILQNCRGDAFEVDKLVAAAKDCSHTVAEFYGWAEFANRYYSSFEVANAQASKLEVKAKKLTKKNRLLARSLKTHDALKAKAHSLQERVLKLEGTKTRLKSKNITLEQEIKDSIENQKTSDDKNHELENSSSYKLGSLLISTFKQPFRKLLFLPYELYKLAIFYKN